MKLLPFLMFFLFPVFSWHTFASPKPPDMRILTEILIKNSEIQLRPKLHLGCDKESLGKYLARLITFGSTGDIRRLKATCSEYEPKKFRFKKTDGHWYCIFDAYTSDKNGVSPWNYGLRVALKKTDLSINMEQIDCPGA